jgi:hypothetical protein
MPLLQLVRMRLDLHFDELDCGTRALWNEFDRTIGIGNGCGGK